MGRKTALIIGNSEYADGSLARLIAPHADVNALANILRAADIGGFDEVITLVNESATTVRIAIARFFADKKRDDLLVLYFSGHGVLDERGQLYLAVKDTERTLPKGTAIEASFITDVMDGSNSRRQVLILDCCHSGAFARGAKGTPGASVHTGTAFEGIGTGRIVLTATDATQYAWEGDQVIGQAETSVFTRYLIQGLQTGEADADVDGNITLDELYDYAYSHVVTETPKQTPGKWSYKQQGDIVIARNPRPLAKQVALPAEIQQSIEDSRPWVREGVISELNRLLNGRNLALAQAAHEALKRLAEDDSRKVAAAAAQSLNAYEAGPHAEVERVEQAPPGQERLEAEHLAAEKAKQVAEAKYLNAQQAEEERARQEADRKVKEEAERKTAEAAQRAREAEQMRQTAAKQAQHPPAEALRSGMVTTPPADKSKKMKRVYVVVAIIIIAMILMGILIASTAQPGATPTPPPAIGFADPTRPPAAPTLTPTPNIPAAVTQGGYVVVAQGINFRQDAGATAQDYLQPATTVTSIRSPIPTQSPEPTPTPSVGRTQTRN